MFVLVSVCQRGAGEYPIVTGLWSFPGGERGGYPLSLVPGPFWGVPLVLSVVLCCPPARAGDAPSPPLPRQDRECCFAAGSKSLALMEEDFLVPIMCRLCECPVLRVFGAFTK